MSHYALFSVSVEKPTEDTSIYTQHDAECDWESLPQGIDDIHEIEYEKGEDLGKSFAEQLSYIIPEEKFTVEKSDIGYKVTLPRETIRKLARDTREEVLKLLTEATEKDFARHWGNVFDASKLIGGTTYDTQVWSEDNGFDTLRDFLLWFYEEQLDDDVTFYVLHELDFYA